ncbi:hypothetical protein Pla110_23160 [Polystyrenella longa]|uniref:Uncharacterized protein n=1 Tax=Polystyrenella longa TaxID=2528007 RepID=A0A518CMY8_9PLAN|nr:hypothetical protein [Polystyrenella longa]QDU80585.1 hypothetical protein Pla110_23160 [Polystyrenella longa]
MKFSNSLSLLDSYFAQVPNEVGFSGAHVLLVVGFGILVFLSLVYIGMPLLILKITRLKKHPEITSFDPNKIPAPLDASLDYFESQEKRLENLEFEYVTDVFIRDMAAASRMLGQLWFHTESCTGLLLIHAYAMNNGNITLTSQSVEFSSSFNNGFLVDTSNTKDFGVFPPHPKKIQHSMFWVQNIEKIYQLHQAICQDVMLNATPVNDLDEKYNGDGIEWIRAGIEKEYNDNLKSGFLKETADGEEYRFSVIGAFILTWKSIFPWKQFRFMKMRSKILSKLRDLNVQLN